MNRRLFVLGLSALVTGCVTPAAEASYRHASHGRQRIKVLVLREAVDLGVSVPLALAVAHAESNFNPRALSHKGARGVMQIMPATARGEYNLPADALWDARTNVRVGLHFLRQLINRYGGRVEYALSYYNGGSAVGHPSRPRIIPATRPYVQKVMYLRTHYRRALSKGEI
ncbi:MAG: lytic transglycosylase domain-containing protein [Rhodospirillales bacterium]|nr:lytic transglycosylase domain-containing protein [Rhodospirillales bacterium]MBO6788366.1 lytic transglycosylase domain-containing protein [Rhodospirillales bacterium]